MFCVSTCKEASLEKLYYLFLCTLVLSVCYRSRVNNWGTHADAFVFISQLSSGRHHTILKICFISNSRSTGNIHCSSQPNQPTSSPAVESGKQLLVPGISAAERNFTTPDMAWTPKETSNLSWHKLRLHLFLYLFPFLSFQLMLNNFWLAHIWPFSCALSICWSILILGIWHWMRQGSLVSEWANNPATVVLNP